MCVCVYVCLTYTDTTVYGAQPTPLPQSLVPNTVSWPSLTRPSMQSAPESHRPWEPPGQDQPSAGQLQTDSDSAGYPRTPYAWSTPHQHCFLRFSCRATLQRVRTKPLPSGTTTRSCSACVSTWTTPCCTGERRLLCVLGEPGTERLVSFRWAVVKHLIA